MRQLGGRCLNVTGLQTRACIESTLLLLMPAGAAVDSMIAGGSTEMGLDELPTQKFKNGVALMRMCPRGTLLLS